MLNNEMGDFNLRPGRTDDAGAIGTPPNLIAPGKRMLSSQCPTLAIKDGSVRLVAGSPGADDPQHHALDRPGRPGIRPRPPGGRRRPADAPPVVPRRPVPGRPRLARPDAQGPDRQGPFLADGRPSRDRQHNRGRRRRPSSRSPRPPPRDRQGLGRLISCPTPPATTEAETPKFSAV